MGSALETSFRRAEPGISVEEMSSAADVIPQPVPPGNFPKREHAAPACFHCGDPCPSGAHVREGKVFCCQGCEFVHDLLAQTGLERFYDLGRHPGVRVRGRAGTDRWAYLDDPAVAGKLLDFTDGRVSRVTLHIPAIHCIACVWLLENLFRLHAGIGKSRVNFARRELSVSYQADQISLSGLASLLASIGYEPALTLDSLDQRQPDLTHRRKWLQVGVAGFAFGNIMLFSLPGYMGLDSLSGPMFRTVFGWLSLILAIPVLVFSGADYWNSAWLSWRRRTMTLDVPIAVGLLAIYAQSAWEILSHQGEGYLDSLSGLVFFLLIGRLFQQKTYERMAFDRDYKCFFPLSVLRRTATGEETVSISQLKSGDRVILRNGELLPADALLRHGEALIDYSFVTGESEPVRRKAGDRLYAGGKQMGGAIEAEIVKPVSQSYLTSLWKDVAFQKTTETALDTLTNRYSRRFTLIVTLIAVGAGLFWVAGGDPWRGVKAFTSVLIVACPCALALAAPFTLGSAQRLLARIGVFLKDAHVIEKLAAVETVVLDKTGTLTDTTPDVSFRGPAELSPAESAAVCAVAAQSTHPYSRYISDSLASAGQPKLTVRGFREMPSLGVEADAGGMRIVLGSRAWLTQLCIPTENDSAGVLLAIDGRHRGTFEVRNRVRPEVGEMIRRLAANKDLVLLSGDNERERPLFQEFPGFNGNLRFNQTPLDKLSFVRDLQASGKKVMMVGDGLNDAGALKQSDAGIAVVERTGCFSPASEAICTAAEVRRLPDILEFARRSTRIVRLSFAISAGYNAVGISISAAGILSPLICAVLMPTSSISVVLFACGATTLAARKLRLTKAGRHPRGEDANRTTRP